MGEIMSEIRSAREIALEKVNEIEDITEEDRLRWKLVPIGEKLAQRYLTEDLDLEQEIASYNPGELLYIKQGMIPIIIAGLDLPRTEVIKDNNQKISTAVMILKDDKEAVAELLGKLQQLFDHYKKVGDQQKQQAYQAFKTNFENRIRQTVKEQQGIEYSGNMNVEQYPQFQEEWKRVSSQYDRQYMNSIDRIRKELLETA